MRSGIGVSGRRTRTNQFSDQPMSSSREPAVFQRHQEAQGPALLAMQQVGRLPFETCLVERKGRLVSASVPEGWMFNCRQLQWQ
jgi:hypothetical protein